MKILEKDRKNKPRRNKNEESDSIADISLRGTSASPFDLFEENEEDEDDYEVLFELENVKGDVKFGK